MKSATTVIITAGGIGKRMQSKIPKQFIEVNELPILMHTISAFHNYSKDFEIILTLPKDWIDYWNDLILSKNFKVKHTLVFGGEERYHSIQNALEKASNDTVLIHDGVRPLVSSDTISNVIQALENYQAAIPIIESVNSLRHLNSQNTNTAVKRNEFVQVQTPQGFHRETILKAYQQPYHSGVTDDATLAEEIGVGIHLVKGNPENIKITTSLDLSFFEFIVNKS